MPLSCLCRCRRKAMRRNSCGRCLGMNWRRTLRRSLRAGVHSTLRWMRMFPTRAVHPAMRSAINVLWTPLLTRRNYVLRESRTLSPTFPSRSLLRFPTTDDLAGRHRLLVSMLILLTTRGRSRWRDRKILPLTLIERWFLRLYFFLIRITLRDVLSWRLRSARPLDLRRNRIIRL